MRLEGFMLATVNKILDRLQNACRRSTHLPLKLASLNVFLMAR
jgi:hypothetical protein